MSDPRSRIPSIDVLMGTAEAEALALEFGRDRTVEALRAAVSRVRRQISQADEAGEADEAREAGGAGDDKWSEAAHETAVYVELAAASLAAADVPSLRRVINATGVVLHTNLGRAPLASVAVEAMRAAAAEYSNLEFDLAEGARGSRYTHCVSLLTELTGADDALVVNNAAGALVLALNTVADGYRGVAVSRGELVEIGGGFRIPEVLKRSGARLVEVGSTNRTRVADYRSVVEDETAAAILKVHRSNFRITGFTEEASIEELSGLARESGIPFVHDLGSGLMMDADEVGLPSEPRAVESLAAGSDIVVVSGDKLLGGPQAGILVGDAGWMARMRKNPLCRALRVDKVGLAGLEATLRLYRHPQRALREIPTLRMLAEDGAALRSRAEALARRLSDAVALRQGDAVALRQSDAAAGDVPSPRVVPTKGAVGGGTFPGVELESWAVELPTGAGVDELAARLRAGDPPVVGRIVDGSLRLDVRTVLPGQEDDLVRRVEEALP